MKLSAAYLVRASANDFVTPTESCRGIGSAIQMQFALWDAITFPATNSIAVFVFGSGAVGVSGGAGSFVYTPATHQLMDCMHVRAGDAEAQISFAAAVPKAFDVTWIGLAEQSPDTLSSAVLSSIIDGLTNALRAGRFDLVDRAYKEVDVQKMSLEAMMAFLRVPFVVRDRLAEWAPFLQKVRVEGDRRKITSPQFLKGLI